jgi:hypothetical protein
MMVKKTCRKRLTAFMSTANRYSHASPDIMGGYRVTQYWRLKNRALERKDMESPLEDCLG